LITTASAPAGHIEEIRDAGVKVTVVA